MIKATENLSINNQKNQNKKSVTIEDEDEQKQEEDYIKKESSPYETRLLTRGVPLVDVWRVNQWNISIKVLIWKILLHYHN